MKISSKPARDVLSPVPALFALAFEGHLPDLGTALKDAVRAAKATGDLSTRPRDVSVFHPAVRGGPKRLGFVGMGKPKEVDTERLRRAAAVAQAAAEARSVPELELRVSAGDHTGIDAFAAGAAIAEGMVLGAYKYVPPSKDKPKPRHAQRASLTYSGKSGAEFERGVRFGMVGAGATVFARDLENLPGNIATPTYLAREAKKLQKERIKVRVLTEADMKRLKMGALLGVSRGSSQPAKLMLLDYHPPGAKGTVCVVGKGLTFDSGGISIKPSSKMDEMRYDMCGGGAVLGLFWAIAHGGLTGSKSKVRVVGVVPSSENMPDASAQKPGDVVTACDGHTIEVLNTDAEGRLILADALAYAIKTYKPKQVVDLATLTGAVIVALGHEVAAAMGNDDRLIEALRAAGKACDEPLWQLPLWDVHREQIRSKFADVANINSPSHGNGSISGGAFLQKFVGTTPWAHLDIAGTAWGGISKDYHRTGATGTAVRTLLHWVRGLS